MVHVIRGLEPFVSVVDVILMHILIHILSLVVTCILGMDISTLAIGMHSKHGVYHGRA